MKRKSYGIIILVVSLILTTTIEARGGGRSSGSRSSGGSRRSSSSSSHSSSNSGSHSYGNRGSHSYGNSGSHSYGNSGSHTYGNSGSSSGSHGSVSSNSGNTGGFWSRLFGTSSSSKSSSSQPSPSETPSYNSPSSYNTPSMTYYRSYKPETSYERNYYPSSYGNSYRPKQTIDSDTNDFLNGYATGNVLSISRPSYRSPTSHDNSRSYSSVYGSGDELPTVSELESGTIAKIDYTKIIGTNNFAVTTETLDATTESTSTEISSTTTESTVSKTYITPHIKSPKTDDAIKSSDGNLLQTVAAIGESNPDISAPYGMICAPIVYEEINEFNINIFIEKLACYPAPQPVENKL